jgi:carbonic anhydrase
VSLAEELLAANEAWAAGFGARGLHVRPRRRLAVLTCMDSRYTAQGVLGFRLGDVHVVRNAGGRVTEDVIRSLVLSAVKLGTEGCVVIHHTNCGLFAAANEELRAAVREASGASTEIDFLPFADLDQSVREDVARLRATPELPPGYEVVGFAYDVDTGQLRLVEA